MTDAQPCPSSVLVIAEDSLVADAVCRALAARGFVVERRLVEQVVADPGSSRSTPRAPGSSERDHGSSASVLMLSDLATPERLARAQTAARRLGGPCLLLTDAAPGPEWGAMLEAGVTTVMASTAGLDEVVAAIREDTGEDRGLSSDRRSELQQTWRTHVAQREARAARIESLTPRERSVLEVIYRGVAVVDVAAFYRVSEATVRSQVRAVLAKLGVGTQLEAVAEYASFRADTSADGEGRPAVGDTLAGCGDRSGGAGRPHP